MLEPHLVWLVQQGLILIQGLLPALCARKANIQVRGHNLVAFVPQVHFQRKELNPVPSVQMELTLQGQGDLLAPVQNVLQAIIQKKEQLHASSVLRTSIHLKEQGNVWLVRLGIIHLQELLNVIRRQTVFLQM